MYAAAQMAGARVELEGVTKHYSDLAAPLTALSGVTLSVDPGGAVAVTGPSGSGKSTLLHILGAMDRPDGGRVCVDGVDVSALGRHEQAAYRRTIGFVFQRFHLLPALSAIDNVAVPLLPFRTEFDKHDRARELLDLVGLASRAQSLPSELSGGEQQRVAIARALVNDPRLLLADEPTGNLDSKTGVEIVELLLDLRGRRGMTVVVATHNSLVAARCDRIVRLQDGHLRDDVEIETAAEPAAMLQRISRIDSLR